MSFFGSRDWLLDVKRGVVSGFSVVNKFGKNPAVGTGNIEDIWYTGGLYVWPTVASTLEAISASANDTAAGSGARVITVEGITILGAPLSVDITMNGTTVTTATTEEFFRVNRAFVKDSGTYATGMSGSHDGLITIRISGVGATQCVLPIENSLPLGQTQIGRYSLGANETGYVFEMFENVAANKDATLYFQTRENADNVSAPFDARRVMVTPAFFTGLDNNVFRSALGPIVGMADMWWNGIASVGGGVTDISVDFGILIEDTS